MPDEVEDLVKEYLAERREADAVFQKAAAIVEKYRAQYPELSSYEPEIDLSARRISFKQTLIGEKDAALAVFELQIGEDGAVFNAKITGKEDEDIKAEDWSFSLYRSLAGIIAAILCSRNRATGIDRGGIFKRPPSWRQ